MSNKKRYVVQTGHDYGALADHPETTIVNSLGEAADVVAKFMKDYGFIVKDGELFDPANADKDGTMRDEVFIDIKWHNGRVIEFTHCDGDGPVARVRKAK